MNDYEDPWIIFSGEMAEEFFRRHRETMPENPHDVWDSNEVLFFCYAFGLGAARFNFKAKNRASFSQREARYIDFFRQMDGARDESGGLGDLFWKRFYEYSSLLDKGTGSFFSALTGSVFKPACKAFVSNSCKRYIFSHKDLVGIISPWLTEKSMEFDKNVAFE